MHREINGLITLTLFPSIYKRKHVINGFDSWALIDLEIQYRVTLVKCISSLMSFSRYVQSKQGIKMRFLDDCIKCGNLKVNHKIVVSFPEPLYV